MTKTRFAIRTLLACALLGFIAAPAARAQQDDPQSTMAAPDPNAADGSFIAGAKKLLHLGNEGAQPLYVNPIVPDGATEPNKMDTSLLKPYMFGAYAGKDKKKKDPFGSALATLDQLNMMASDAAESQRNAKANAILAADTARVNAYNQLAMQKMQQQMAAYQQQSYSRATNMLDLRAPAQAQAPSRNTTGTSPRGSNTMPRTGTPILMPH